MHARGSGTRAWKASECSEGQLGHWLGDAVSERRNRCRAEKFCGDRAPAMAWMAKTARLARLPRRQRLSMRRMQSSWCSSACTSRTNTASAIVQMCKACSVIMCRSAATVIFVCRPVRSSVRMHVTEAFGCLQLSLREMHPAEGWLCVSCGLVRHWRGLGVFSQFCGVSGPCAKP